MTIATLVTHIFAWSTLGLNILLVFFFVALVTRTAVTDRIVQWVGTRAILIGFLASLAGLVGSLVYSEAVGFTPCILCWIQRLFLYPQVVLFGVALWREEKMIIPYAYILSLCGAAVALYHSFTQLGGHSLTPCTSEGGECSKIFVLEFGYITIPMMALSLFIAIICVCIAARRAHRLSSIM